MLAATTKSDTRYELVVGMEVHVQLLTRSKMFCRCATDYAGAPPNTRVCPVCLGMPGTLPVINRDAVEATVKTGLALGCEIAETAVFARKNYTYPDLPKGYQISQFELPLCIHGRVDVDLPDGSTSPIRVRRACTWRRIQGDLSTRALFPRGPEPGGRALMESSPRRIFTARARPTLS